MAVPPDLTYRAQTMTHHTLCLPCQHQMKIEMQYPRLSDLHLQGLRVPSRNRSGWRFKLFETNHYDFIGHSPKSKCNMTAPALARYLFIYSWGRLIFPVLFCSCSAHCLPQDFPANPLPPTPDAKLLIRCALPDSASCLWKDG